MTYPARFCVGCASGEESIKGRCLVGSSCASSGARSWQLTPCSKPWRSIADFYLSLTARAPPSGSPPATKFMSHPSARASRCCSQCCIASARFLASAEVFYFLYAFHSVCIRVRPSRRSSHSLQAMPRMEVALWSCEADPKKRAHLISRKLCPTEPKFSIQPSHVFGDVITLSTETQPWCFLHEKRCNVPPAEIMVGGFPCKSLSPLNVRRSSFNWQKGSPMSGVSASVFYDVVSAVKTMRPAFLVLENVPGVVHRLKDREGSFADVVVEELSKLGYEVEFRLIDTSAFLPQKRKRVWHLPGPEKGLFLPCFIV